MPAGESPGDRSTNSADVGRVRIDVHRLAVAGVGDHPEYARAGEGRALCGYQRPSGSALR